MGRIILTASGKGGVGKTTLTANIAACISDRNKKVLCLDADLRLRNLDIILNMTAQAVFDIQDVFSQRCDFEKAVLQHSVHRNLFFIPGPSSAPEDIDSLYQFLTDLAHEKIKDFDYIFIDCPSGIGSSLEIMLKKGIEVLIVATPDQASMRDAEKTAELVYSRGAIPRLIVNRIRPILIKKGLAPDIDDIIDSTAVRLIGIMPESARVLTGSANGVLLCDAKRTRAGTAAENIAARIDGQKVPLIKFRKTQ